MEIYYHDCKYSNFEINGSGEDETRNFDCLHPDMEEDRECKLNNYLLARIGNCDIADKGDNAR